MSHKEQSTSTYSSHEQVKMPLFQTELGGREVEKQMSSHDVLKGMFC